MIQSTTNSPAEPTRPPSEPVRHLTQLDLARRWRISPRTLERWRWLRQGPCYLKIGGRVAYCLEDVLAFEVAQRWSGTSASSSQPKGRAVMDASFAVMSDPGRNPFFRRQWQHEKLPPTTATR